MAVRLGVAENGEALAANAAAEFLRLAADAIARRGAFRVALAGGDTPRAAYERIAADWREAPGGALAWDHVHVYWSDERMVPRDDPRSNYAMAAAALLSRVPIPAANVHPIPVDAGKPDAAAAEYEALLRTAIPSNGAPAAPPRFDLVLLGMGADGHTASLFPGAAALGETTRFAVAARHPETGEPRVTLTLPVLNHAAAVMVLVAGRAKSAMLERAVRGAGRRTSDARLPAELLRPTMGTLDWLADEEAAPWARSESTGPNT